VGLEPGSKLGPYLIEAELGAGGMGQVYRASDTRLQRTVAIKVLSATLVSSPEAKQRFEREARAISQLQHPNICVLHDVGHDSGVDYLVLEYLDGETLGDRLKKGPLGASDAIAIARQVADALVKAHRSGIVHRDLKPGNVMLTKSGAKLMDFGLAKPSGFQTAAGSGSVFSAALTNTSPASPLTSVGSIIGTVQYMAPEQIEGREADVRSDIFSFGLVLFEMLSGRRAFEGKTQASIVASILALEPPPLVSLQPAVPATLDQVVRICLRKDPDERFQNAHDLKLQLEMIESSAASAATTAPPTQRSSVMVYALAAALVVSLLVASASWWRLNSQPVTVVRGALLAPEGTTFSNSGTAQISPDGRYVVYGAVTAGVRRLWLQSFASTDPVALAGTEGASYPFWSPDSRSVAFFSGNKLRRVDINGGPPLTICDSGEGRGGAWNRDGVILFGGRTAPLMKVSAAGGAPTPLTKLDEKAGEHTHRWPNFLPDGKHFLFMTGATGNDNPTNAIYLGALDSPETRKLFVASSNVVYVDGYILYRRESSLLAQPFDARKAVTTGDAIPIADQIRFDPSVSVATFSASNGGTLVYQAGGNTAGSQQLTWFDSTGKKLGTIGKQELGYSLALAPDGKHTAQMLVDQTGNQDVWVYDTTRELKIRLTFDPQRQADPVWFPDSKRVVYSSEIVGSGQLFAKNADGSGSEERLLESKAIDFPEDISADGRHLVFTRRTAGNTGFDIMVLPLFGDRKPFAYLQTQFNEAGARISPDGKWLAYSSDESGRDEVYISTFPQAGSKWQVSNGGAEPRWSASGKELYYISSEEKLMLVPISVNGNSVQPGAARELFQMHSAVGRKQYSVARDGRILVNSVTEARSTAPLSFTLNWKAALKK
jgi:serine/threonine protein kinase/Tol biopolymer transport system component